MLMIGVHVDGESGRFLIFALSGQESALFPYALTKVEYTAFLMVSEGKTVYAALRAADSKFKDSGRDIGVLLLLLLLFRLL